MSLTPQNGAAIKPRTTLRRANDKALLGIAGFLFLINIIFGTYIFVTTNRVDEVTSDLRDVVCVTNAAYRAAYVRETQLVKTGPKNQIKAHKRSAATLKVYLDRIDPLVKCDPVSFELPSEPE